MSAESEDRKYKERKEGRKDEESKDCERTTGMPFASKQTVLDSIPFTAQAL